MKNIFYSLFLTAFIIAGFDKLNAQSANTSLSNLVSPTKVNVDLLPDRNSKRNLGSLNRGWLNLYVDSAIYIDSSRFIAFKTGSGIGNTAIGKDGLNSDISGYSNTAVGFRCLYYNQDGHENTALGRGVLYKNTGGYDNTATGYQAMLSNTTGDYNTAIGNSALYSNTNGLYNTANGSQALSSNTTGSDNTANGASALSANTTGAGNTANGVGALRYNTIGHDNTSDGFSAGSLVKDGDDNTFIGSLSNCGSGGHLINATALGYNATVTSSNHVMIGNSNVTSIGGYANWSNISDGRVKKNIKQNVPGLSFINKLNPITYNLDLDEVDKIIERPVMKDKEARPDDPVVRGNVIQPTSEQIASRREKEQIVYTGFIAQDVEKTAKELNYDFSGVDKPDNANTLYGLRYAEFVVPLVKAVQELSQQNDELKKNYQTKISELERQVDELKEMIVSGDHAQSGMSNELSVMSGASLSQNIPNPFNHTTTINYTLPQQYSSAKIIITDKNGNVLEESNLAVHGKGSFTVDASTLSAGAYQYSLYVNGRLISTKQMVLSK